jgi:GTP cyclohydrolase I
MDNMSDTDGSIETDDKLTAISAAYTQILKVSKFLLFTLVEVIPVQLVGEDPSRDGLQNTPMRAAKAFMDFTVGYSMSVQEVVGEGVFVLEAPSDEAITVKDIEIYSLCEHHLVPFFGKV